MIISIIAFILTIVIFYKVGMWLFNNGYGGNPYRDQFGNFQFPSIGDKE